MGRAGAPYATDTLLGLVADAARQTSASATCSPAWARSSRRSSSRTSCAPRASTRWRSPAPRPASSPTASRATPRSPRSIPARLLAAIDEGMVPVVAGFQGIAEDGTLTTLGRGGCDTTRVRARRGARRRGGRDLHRRRRRHDRRPARVRRHRGARGHLAPTSCSRWRRPAAASCTRPRPNSR